MLPVISVPGRTMTVGSGDREKGDRHVMRSVIDVSEAATPLAYVLIPYLKSPQWGLRLGHDL